MTAVSNLDDGPIGVAAGQAQAADDGSLTRDDGTLSAWLGRAVRLRSADEEVARRYEDPVDFEHEATSVWAPFDGAAGAFHDSADTVTAT